MRVVTSNDTLSPTLFTALCFYLHWYRKLAIFMIKISRFVEGFINYFRLQSLVIDTFIKFYLGLIKKQAGIPELYGYNNFSRSTEK